MRTRRRLTILAAELAGLTWYLRGWQPRPDTACARLTETAPDEGELLNSISPAELRRDTVSLSAIRPRNGGTPGVIQAREWVVARFQELGLRRVRLEAVVYPHWVGEGARLTLLSAPAAELPCLALNGSAATPPEGVKAPLVDVGDGQVADYLRRSVEETQGTIHLAQGGSLHRREICLNATRAGAVGVIITHPDSRPVDLGASDDVYLVEAGTSVVLGRLPTLAVSYGVGQRLRNAARRGTPVRLSVARR